MLTRNQKRLPPALRRLPPECRRLIKVVTATEHGVRLTWTPFAEKQLAAAKKAMVRKWLAEGDRAMKAMLKIARRDALKAEKG